MSRLAKTLLALLPLVVLASCGGPRHALVLVTIGGLRADAVDPAKTPRLAALLAGEDAIRYRSSSPSTNLALAGLMTGRAPDELGLRYGDLARVPADVPVLAQRLRERGYKTAAFVSDGEVGEQNGFGRGFDLFTTPVATGNQAVTALEVGRVRPAAGAYLPGETITDFVGQHLWRVQLVRNTFVWIHLSDLELALAESPAGDAYAGRLAAVENAVAYLQDALGTFDMASHTHLVVVAAHGMGLGEQGEQGHGLTLSPGVIDVAAGVAGPSTWDEKARGAAPLDSAGLGRAIARLAGLADPPADGPSLAVSATFVGEREFGVPPRAAVGDASGWLVLDPAPEWQPAGDAAPGGTWPEAHAERARALGISPGDAATALSGPPLSERLAAMQEIRTASIGGEGAGDAVVAGLKRLLADAPETYAARLTLLRQLAPAGGAALGDADPEIALETLLAHAGDSTARAIDLARALLAVGRASEARSVIAQLDDGPLTAGEKLAAARVLEGARDGQRALELVASVAEADGEAPELHEWIGDLALAEGNGFRARVAYEAAIESPRRNVANVLAKLGDAFRLLGDDDAALRRYAAALELDEGYLYPHARAAEVYLARGEQGAAAHALAMSVPSTPDPVADALARADRMAGVGLLGAARRELEAGLEARPKSRPVRLRLARVHTLLGELDAAAPLVEAVLMEAPESGPALYEQARIAALSGETGRAVETLKKLATLAGPGLAAQVRADEVFRAEGPSSALAQAAEAVRGVEGPKGGRSVKAGTGAS